MKFLHLGDLHIGKSLAEFDLYDDQAFILAQILEIALEKSVDAVLIAGDVYDKSIPSEAAVRLFDDFIKKLSDNNLKTFIISGNHDSDERLNFGSALFESNNIYISAKYSGELYKKSFSDEYGEINIYLMPFVKASSVKRFYPDEEITTYEDAINTIISHAEIDNTQRNVIVAHQFVTASGKDIELGGSEGLSVTNVGMVEKIDSKSFNKFDYVALGHIHSGQRVGREAVRYSGSPLKYSVSEANSKKSVPIVELSKKGELSIELIDLKPMRDLRHIKGPLKELILKANVVSPEDYIYATLTDEDYITGAIGYLQQAYPNIVKVDYDNRHSSQIDHVDITDITKGRTFIETISDFYSQIYGTDISEEEIEIMKTVAKEAGIDETN